jgi:putative oxidoreductase
VALRRSGWRPALAVDDGAVACQSISRERRPAIAGDRALSVAEIVSGVISGTDAAVRGDRTAARVAIVSGVIFVFAGLVKFVFHHWELHAFQSFGLPDPSVLEILAGVFETAGGVLLVLRLVVLPTALMLAVTMVVAIWSSGIDHGDVIPSLTLAPALLLAMVFLLVRARPGVGPI